MKKQDIKTMPCGSNFKDVYVQKKQEEHTVRY